MLNSYHVLTQLRSQWEYDETILKRLIELLDFYLQKHSKVLVVRYDLTFPVNYPQVCSNDLISSFMQKFIQKYKRQGYDPCYVWTRECNTSIHPHYHCVLLLNGHKVRDFHHVFENAQLFWGSTLGVDVSGQVHHCTGQTYYQNFKNGIMIEKYKPDEAQCKYDAVVSQLSYLAKMAGKREPGDPWRNFGMSELH